jgi:hypothetical protein
MRVASVWLLSPSRHCSKNTDDPLWDVVSDQLGDDVTSWWRAASSNWLQMLPAAVDMKNRLWKLEHQEDNIKVTEKLGVTMWTSLRWRWDEITGRGGGRFWTPHWNFGFHKSGDTNEMRGDKNQHQKQMKNKHMANVRFEVLTALKTSMLVLMGCYAVCKYQRFRETGLKMETVCSSETLVSTCKSTRR